MKASFFSEIGMKASFFSEISMKAPFFSEIGMNFTLLSEIGVSLRFFQIRILRVPHLQKICPNYFFSLLFVEGMVSCFVSQDQIYGWIDLVVGIVY